MPETSADVLDSLWVGLASDGADGGGRTAAALGASKARFDVLLDLMPQMVWSTRPDGYHDYYNERWYEFTGVPKASTDGEAWIGMFHPEDQPRTLARWQHSLQTGEPYEIEYRLRHRSGAYRWVLGRALPVRDGDGRIVRWIGTCTDIHDARMLAEQNMILSRELSHRIKNIFAVIAGLIGLAARRYPEHRGFAEQLQDRIGALGRAHEFVRPHSERSRPTVGETTLRTLITDVLSAYPALEEGRISIVGADAAIDDCGATPIALAFHELATNSAKYGALSAPGGEVAMTLGEADGWLTIEWRERGGPPVAGEPERVGFGTRLVELSIVQQLDGAIAREWPKEGLVARLRVRPERLARVPQAASA